MSTGLKLLAAILQSESGSNLARIDEEMLVGEREVAAFDFCKRYYRRTREVPPADLVNEHTGIAMPRASGNVSFHMDNLQDRFDFSIIRESWENLRQQVQEGAPRPVIETMEQTIRSVRRNKSTSNMVDIHQGMEQVIQRLERVMPYGGMSGVPTPWPTLNEATGGYQNADLITFVGRTSMGKTANLLKQAEQAYEEGYSVLFVTTEMGSEQIARRWMAMTFGLSGDHLKKGTVSTYLLRRIKAMQAELVGRERFRLLSVGTNAKVSAVEAAVEELAPDIIFLDGVYLLYPKAGNARMGRIERITAVIDDVKQCTIDSDRPWVISTQFNREAGKKGVDGALENIGLSDAIAWHSSIVIAIKPGPTANPEHSRELDSLKGREGEQFNFAINFRFKPVDFSEMTHEQLEEIGATAQLNVGEDWE